VERCAAGPGGSGGMAAGTAGTAKWVVLSVGDGLRGRLWAIDAGGKPLRIPGSAPDSARGALRVFSGTAEEPHAAPGS